MRRHDERPSNNREKIRAVTLPTMKDLNIEIFDKVLRRVKIKLKFLLYLTVSRETLLDVNTPRIPTLAITTPQKNPSPKVARLR